MSLYDVYDLCEYAKEKLPHVEIAKETCTATKIRQEAIQNMDEDIDIVFIVGDPHSNNTQKLASIAKKNREVYMIESIDDLDVKTLKGKKKAAVSSGASTPTYLTNQVIDFLKQFLPSHPLPVILVSSLNLRVFDALAAGAVDFVRKPDAVESRESFLQALTHKIIVASHARLSRANLAPPCRPRRSRYVLAAMGRRSRPSSVWAPPQAAQRPR